MDRTVLEKIAPASLGGVLYLSFDQLLGMPMPMPAGIAAAALGGIVSAIIGNRGKRGKTAEGRRRFGVRLRGKLRLGAAMMAVSGFCLAFASSSLARYSSTRSYSGLEISQVNSIEVVLTEDPHRTGPGRWAASGLLRRVMSEGSAALGGAEAAARGSVLIFGSGDAGEIGAGRRAVFRGRLKRTGGSEAVSFIFSSDDGTPGPWIARILSSRHRLLARTGGKLSRCRPDTASFLSALLLGRKTDSGSPVMMRIQSAGCMHLLALSGFHVGLIALTLRRILKPAGPAVSSVVSAAASVIYLFFAGLRPSLVRAVAMFCFWAFDRARGIRITPGHYLAAAFLLQCVFFPRCTSSLAFRLSYAALLGLLTAGVFTAKLLKKLRLGRLADIFGAGAGAHAATMPFVVSSFGAWRPIGMAAAPILTPMVALSMAIGAAIIALPEEYGLFRAAVTGADFLVSAVSAAAEPFSGAPAVAVPIAVAWPAALCGVILPVLFPRRTRNAAFRPTEPRLPSLNPQIPGSTGDCSKEALGAEFSHQPRSQGEDHRTPGRWSGDEGLGDRAGSGRHERIHPECRGGPDGLRDRSGILRLADRISRRARAGIGARRRHKDVAGSLGSRTAR